MKSQFTNQDITITWTPDGSNRLSNAQEYQKDSRNHRRQNVSKLPYPNRPFLAVDGEGVTHHPNHPQSYVLLGVSDGSSDRQIHAYDLSTEECLRFLIKMEREFPNHIKVAFAFNYDVNMIVKDIPEPKLEELINGEWVQWHEYKLKWLPNKWLEVSCQGTYTIIYDTFTFFACSFLAACEQYLPANDPELQTVITGKGERNVFTYDELDTFIRPYMVAELHLMAKLVTRLRELLESIDIIPSGWHGPGAIATRVLANNNVRRFRPDVETPTIRSAAQFAYYGGRFEAFKTGFYDDTVYQYDIRSAYPYALTQCPELTDEYEYQTFGDSECVPDFSLCQVTYIDGDIARTGINPIPMRNRQGSIHYSNMVQTWIWGVEYNVAMRYNPQSIRLDQCMVFNDTGVRPFAFVGDIYEQRAQWKREGNPAQLAAKLGINSIYGKLAQRVGWNRENGTAPRAHQLRWAGYTTAVCRSMIMQAMAQAPNRIIAVETDGIFSEVPLDLNIGSLLGEWDAEQYSGIMYVQSGIYFARDNDGEWSKGKTRGFAANKANFGIAENTVGTLANMVTESNRFHGIKRSIGTDHWRTWQSEKHIVQWGGNGKRYHRDCITDGCTEIGIIRYSLFLYRWMDNQRFNPNNTTSRGSDRTTNTLER